ncbi:replication initiation protein RepC [Sphingomonas sp. H160509]|uniref:replication initiation protein RepC n=1 Tax=Sphingomonas sp. H160509 TaxID=2955313 RepID=UPI0021E93E16|nr:replication initiation protein RepC [Sphingomonas sp. H160509]MDD1453348.1 replication initiation protein RepC [Sphingomonas sp. H160509]
MPAAFPSFQRVAADRKAAWQQGQRLREDVSALRNKVLALADAGREQCAAGDWQRIEDDARQLAASRGTSREPGHLARIVAELDEIYQGALEALTPCGTVDSDPVGPENRPLHTTTNQLPNAKANTIEDGPCRPDALKKPESSREDFTRKTVSPGLKGQMGERERRDDDALRGFDVSPEFVVKIAPIFAPWIGNTRPTWNVLLDASTYVRSELGISQHAWGQACTVMGRVEAVVLLATIAARHEAGAIGSPGGVMRRMVELHQEGKLRLDRTLFGLADRLKGRVH